MNEKIFCQIGSYSSKILTYWTFFKSFFKSLIINKDPDPKKRQARIQTQEAT
jgi:hypothetical protein